MAYILDLDEIATALADVGTPEASKALSELEAAATKASRILAECLGIKTTYADLQDGRIMAPFFAVEEGQAIPNPIRGYDDESEWCIADGHPSAR